MKLASLTIVAIGTTSCIALGDGPVYRNQPQEADANNAAFDAGAADANVAPNAAPREIYQALVEPELRDNCGSCHGDANPGSGPDFLNAGDYYDDLLRGTTLAGEPLLGTSAADSPLSTKGSHAGPAFSDNALQGIDIWLDAEAAQAPDAGLPGPESPAQALEWFSSCLSYETWQQYQMEDLARQPTEREPCYGCHSLGEHDTYLSLDIQETHAAHVDPLGSNILHLVRPYYDGAYFSELIQANSYVNQGAIPGHPSYVMADELRVRLDAMLAQVLNDSRYGPCQ